MDDDDPADADASPGVWGGTLTDEADPPPPEHATAPHTIAATASAPHPARRRRPDEPGDPPDDTDESDGTGVGAPDGRRTGNHDTEELLPQGP